MSKLWNGPESKLCECGAVFDRVGNSNDLRWKNTKRCPSCRRSRDGDEPATENKGRILGQYEVKNPLLDKFLYAKPPT